MTHTVDNEHASLLQFLYACPVGMVQITGDGAIGLINPLAMQILLPIAQQPLITNFFDVLEAYAPELRNMADAFAEPNGAICTSHRIFVSASSGHEGAEDARVLACTLVKVGADRFLATLEDASKAVAQERRLKQAEIWFASLLDDVDDFAVISLDAEGRIDGVNPSVTRQTGFSAEEVLGQSLAIFDIETPESSTLSTPEQMACAQRTGWHLDEGWRERRGGARYWCQRLIAVQSKADGDNEPIISGYTVILRDVNRQEFDSAKLRHMLTTDFLTGANNRAHFFEVAERERLRSSRNHDPLSVIALDVDHFKRVNDTYGHVVGDMVLKKLSTVCKTVLRPTDTFARFGGEEFLVLLPSTDLAGAEAMAERLRAAIATAPIEVDGGLLRITASLGCAPMANAAMSLTEFLAEADDALYEAKRLGRNRVVVSGLPRGAADVRATASPLSRQALARVLQSLLTVELASVRRRSARAGGAKPRPGGIWGDEFQILGDGPAALGCDSLEIMWLAAATNEMFHLHEAGGETALLSAASFGDWLDHIIAAWRAGVSRITFSTSGTTGTPKRCTHPLAHLQTEIGFLSSVFATRRRIVAMTPAHHIYGFLLTALVPDHLDIAVLQADHATAIALKPGDLVVSYPERWSWLRRFVTDWPGDVEGVVSTAPCSPELIADLKAQGLAKMTEIYGSSETAGVALRDSPHDAYRLMPHWRFATPIDPKCPALIADSGFRSQLMDQITIRADRTFTLAGRRDGAQQVGGTNVHPDRVAALLASRPGVVDASVRLAAPAEGGRLKAFVVPNPATSECALRSDLEAWSTANLSTAERPRTFTFGASLPRDVMGKPADWQADYDTQSESETSP